MNIVPQVRKSERAFTTVEAVIGMALLLIVVVSVYTGLTFSFDTIRTARENTRATQIMVEKTEQLRLFNWDQLTNPTNSFIQTNFIVPYYATNIGVTYTGWVTLKPVSIAGTGYTNDMREVTVTLKWVTGKLPRQRTLVTYVSRYGLQNYLY